MSIDFKGSHYPKDVILSACFLCSLWRLISRLGGNHGQTLDFMLSERRDTAAARRFFKRAVGTNGVPERIAIDKSGANLATATLAGIEAAHMIRKGQLGQNGMAPFKLFAALAG